VAGAVRAIEPFYPKPDQLRGDAHPVASLANAPFEHIAHAQLAGDLADVSRFPL
jgi:hypothetical protein